MKQNNQFDAFLASHGLQVVQVNTIKILLKAVQTLKDLKSRISYINGRLMWHSCTDRLPEDDDEVACYNANTGAMHKWFIHREWKHDGSGEEWEEVSWSDGKQDFDTDEVTHWARLPDMAIEAKHPEKINIPDLPELPEDLQ